MTRPTSYDAINPFCDANQRMEKFRVVSFGGGGYVMIVERQSDRFEPSDQIHIDDRHPASSQVRPVCG